MRVQYAFFAFAEMDAAMDEKRGRLHFMLAFDHHAVSSITIRSAGVSSDQ